MKMVRRLSVLLVASLVFLSACQLPFWRSKTEIIESTHLSDINQHLEPGALVIIDIDQTLIKTYLENKKGKKFEHPCNVYDIMVYFMVEKTLNKHKKEMLKKIYKLGVPQTSEQEALLLIRAELRPYAYKKMIDLGVNEGKVFKIRAVEKDSAAIVEKLQNDGYSVMSCTARDWSGREKTGKDLLRIGIDIDEKTIRDKEIVQKPTSLTNGFGFKDGVLYVIKEENGYVPTNKGSILVNFFEKISYSPKKVIFVDDKKYNVDDVATAFDAHGIPGVCLWYKACGCEDDKTFDTALIKEINQFHKKGWEVLNIDQEKIVSVVFKELCKAKKGEYCA